MFESVCLTKVMIIFQDMPIIKRMAQIRRERVCPRDIFFVIGIVGMIASAVAAVFSARILRRQEKKLKEQIWNEYQ